VKNPGPDPSLALRMTVLFYPGDQDFFIIFYFLSLIFYLISVAPLPPFGTPRAV
jgi:hypothetical protein